MKFSLVTTCLNEVRSLPRWRKDLERQTRQPDEISIVDAQSTDGTTEALREWAAEDNRVRLRVEKCNAARGRNLAVSTMVSYDHIVSTDMGIRLHPCWLEEIIRPFETDPGVEVVVGSCAVDSETVITAAARAEVYITGDIAPFITGSDGQMRLRPGRVPGNLSMAYKKTMWAELGGYPEDLTLYADDSVFGRQIVESGCKMAFAPNALVFWARHRDLSQFWKEQLRYGFGDGEAFIKTPFAFRLHQNYGMPRILVPLLTGLREVNKHMTLAALLRALRAKDLAAIAIMPLFLFGRGYSFGRGYMSGYDRGSTHCIGARARVHN
jgi:glycosyltransferase involved in cell wall biosynthesis